MIDSPPVSSLTGADLQRQLLFLEMKHVFMMRYLDNKRRSRAGLPPFTREDESKTGREMTSDD